jgi:hypothetical protein
MKTPLTFTLTLLSLCAYAQNRTAHPAEGTRFQQFAEITGTQAGDDFGSSVAVSGNTLVVGAPFASDVCQNCGAAYVYTAVNGDWTNPVQVATLIQPAVQASPGGFGSPVAISGDAIVVGGLDAQAQEAVAYVYVNPSGTTTQAARLTTSVVSGGQIDGIGIEGSTVVVGMPFARAVPHGEGAAFAYVEPSSGWSDMTQTAVLVSKDVVGPTTAFGASVGVSGRNIVVGATEVTIGGIEQGSAYLFVEPAAGWSGTRLPTTQFEASNGIRKAQFGNSVSASGDTVAVGAPDETVGSSQNEGAVYIFTRPSSGWPKTMTETAELTASGAKAGSELGFSVALSGQTLVAGAPFEHSVQGLAYVFRESSGGWQSSAQAEDIAASDGAPNNNFGYSVFLGGGIIAVGSPGWPRGSLSEDGEAYVFGKNQ